MLGSWTCDLHQHCGLEEERPYMEYQQEVWIYINFNDRDIKCVQCVCVSWAWVSSDTYGSPREHLSTSGICMRFWQPGREFLGHLKVLGIWEIGRRKSCSFTSCKTRHDIISIYYPDFIKYCFTYLYLKKIHTIWPCFSEWRKQKRFRNRERTVCISNFLRAQLKWNKPHCCWFQNNPGDGACC